MMLAICSPILPKCSCKFEAFRIHLKRKNKNFLIIRNYTLHLIQREWLEYRAYRHACINQSNTSQTTHKRWLINICFVYETMYSCIQRRYMFGFLSESFWTVLQSIFFRSKFALFFKRKKQN